MKKDIHPKYYAQAVITCSCGHVFRTGSTVENIYIEVCSACHPYYTGKHKLVDVGGRVDAFKKHRKKAVAAEEEKTKVQQERSERRVKEEAEKKEPDKEVKLG